MELRQLEYFCAIVETGSVSGAARRLNMSQPPLSYQLKQLENELSVTLFSRTGKGCELTEAGILLYERARSLLDYARSTRLEVTETGKKRVLRLGITSSTAATILPYISRFTKRYPDVSFEVRDGTTFSLLSYVLEGILDISVARTPMNRDEVDSFVLQKEPMIAVSPAYLRFDGEKATLSDLSHEPLILSRRYEELNLRAFSEKGLTPDVFCVCDDARDALLWVREGLATAVFPRSMESLCDSLRVRCVEETKLETEIVLIWEKEKRLSPVTRDFLRICRGEENNV